VADVCRDRDSALSGRRPRVLVGGVAHLYQGDLDLGRLALERLGEVGAGVVVEDLSYGAVAVAQRLEELEPERLVLVSAVVRGRPPGTVERRTPNGAARSPEEVQRSVADAATGYLHVDLVLDVAQAFGVLPRDTIVVEVEPASVEPAERLSSVGARALDDAVALVRRELELAQ
jgi:hydrogenase maturation protease